MLLDRINYFRLSPKLCDQPVVFLTVGRCAQHPSTTRLAGTWCFRSFPSFSRFCSLPGFLAGRVVRRLVTLVIIVTNATIGRTTSRHFWARGHRAGRNVVYWRFSVYHLILEGRVVKLKKIYRIWKIEKKLYIAKFWNLGSFLWNLKFLQIFFFVWGSLFWRSSNYVFNLKINQSCLWCD